MGLQHTAPLSFAIPVDVWLEILIWLPATSLIAVSRTSQWLRRLLLRRSAISVGLWSRALSNEGLPKCPPEMPEPRYASLLCEFWCKRCGRDDEICPIIWNAKLRLCDRCIYIDYSPWVPVVAPRVVAVHRTWRNMIEIIASSRVLKNFKYSPSTERLWSKALVWKLEETFLGLPPVLQQQWSARMRQDSRVFYERMSEHTKWSLDRWKRMPQNKLRNMTKHELSASRQRKANIAQLLEDQCDLNVSSISHWDEHPLVLKHGTFSATEWEEMKPVLVEHISQLKTIAAEHAAAKALDRRILVAKEVIERMVLDGSLPARFTTPVFVDLLLLPEVKAIVNTPDKRNHLPRRQHPKPAEPSPPHARDLRHILPAVWKRHVYERSERLLLSLGPAAHTLLAILRTQQTLAHPAAHFTCTSCGATDLRCPLAVMHLCSYTTVSSAPLAETAPVPRPLYAGAVQRRFGCEPWAPGARYRVHPASERVLALMRACGVDPVTGNAVNLDNANVKVRCGACGPGEQKPMGWRTAVVHASTQHVEVLRDSRTGRKTVRAAAEVVWIVAADTR